MPQWDRHCVMHIKQFGISKIKVTLWGNWQQFCLSGLLLGLGFQNFKITWNKCSPQWDSAHESFRSIKVKVTNGGERLHSIILVWAVTWPWLEGFQNCLAQMFVWMRWCGAHMNQVGSSKVKVTLEVSRL